MSVVANKIHKFELHGLGQAPFRLVGTFSLPSKHLAEHNPSAYNAQMASIPDDVSAGMCDYCSTPLMHHFIIRSSDNKRFVVGCDCVSKTGDTGLVNAIKAKKRQINAQKRAEERRVKYEAQMQTQREANGGLTDGELRSARMKAIEDEFKASVFELVAQMNDFLYALKGTNGDFARNMCMNIAGGYLHELSPRVAKIIVEITAKAYGGRMGSKAYHAAYDKYEPLMDEMMEKYKALKEGKYEKMKGL